MISKKLYNKFNKKLASLISEDRIVSYDTLSEYWAEYFDLNRRKKQAANKKSDYIILGHLQVLFWGFLTLSINDEKKQRPNANLLFKSLICSISNTALAIIKLSIDGLEYQSTILLRNLNEACFILLNIIISPEKRVALFESARDEKGYEVWRKYFTFINSTKQSAITRKR